MKLPEGTDSGIITNPQEDRAVQRLVSFQGTIDIETAQGFGFILAQGGTLVAAYYRDDRGSYQGNDALDRIGSADTDNVGHYLQAFSSDAFPYGSGERDFQPRFSLRSYSDEEFREAVDICRSEGLTLTAQGKNPPPKRPVPLDENRLKKMLSLYGIVAISTFYEGFAVQSLGDADFEHVAALAEDLLRAGIKIIREMKIGTLSQLILETGTNKIIIAPCGDLYLCVFARKDAQLGMLRVAIKNLQLELSENSD
ncbi:MAG TPA: roadblock/LC7 domain-containing protein [Methanoregulaceae archaeon]|nr:roadblock/LC7 domain-containing protein [Methanoregulaceae archaeon]